MEIQLDNPHATLVEEERAVPLLAGVNDVVFAWSNTNIDTQSIQFRCLTDPDEINVLSVSYPPNENALTWQVYTPRAQSARVRISYIIYGLDKTYAYRAVAAHDERTLTLRQYIQLHNNANEAFGEAGMATGYGERLERPIDINQTKRVLTAKFTDVPITKVYAADFARHGYLDAGKKQLRIPMFYRLLNDDAHGLGAFPLAAGKMRIFQDDGRGTTAFLGEDWAPFTARDDEMDLFLGVAKDIVVKRTIERRERIEKTGNLASYDIIVKYEIENFKDTPVTLDIVESMVSLRSEAAGIGNQRAVEWDSGRPRHARRPRRQAIDRRSAGVPRRAARAGSRPEGRQDRASFPRGHQERVVRLNMRILNAMTPTDARTRLHQGIRPCSQSPDTPCCSPPRR